MATCHQCGKAIVGAYVKALERFWHPEHFRCSVCRKPITDAKFFVEHGQAAHQRCAEEHLMPRCGLCGRPIQGRYLVDAWGRNYCASHEHGAAACGGCGCPLKPADSWCTRCRSHAVRNEAELLRLYREVARWGARLGLDGVDRDLRLSFMERSDLDRALGGAEGAHYGMTKTRSVSSLLGLRNRPAEIDGIAVLRGAPSSLCRGVLAHEMGHVWFALHGISGGQRQLEEGFCEYLAHRYYGEHALFCREYYRHGIEKNPDATYGEGFRRVSWLIAKVSLSPFLAELKRGEVRL